HAAGDGRGAALGRRVGAGILVPPPLGVGGGLGRGAAGPVGGGAVAAAVGGALFARAGNPSPVQAQVGVDISLSSGKMIGENLRRRVWSLNSPPAGEAGDPFIGANPCGARQRGTR